MWPFKFICWTQLVEYHCNQETKQQSMVWKFSRSPRIQKTVEKILAAIFWEEETLIDYLPQSTTRICAYYVKVLIQLQKANSAEGCCCCTTTFLHTRFRLPMQIWASSIPTAFTRPDRKWFFSLKNRSSTCVVHGTARMVTWMPFIHSWTAVSKLFSLLEPNARFEVFTYVEINGNCVI